MHFKLKIWDLIKSRPDILNHKSPIVAFSSFDPLAFKLIKDKIPKETMFQDGKLNVLLAKEISHSWFDDNFRSMSLFGNQDSFLIHFAEELDTNIKDAIISGKNLLLDSRFLILSFTKEDSFYKKLQKSKSEQVETIHIQAPSFWEEGELLDFICTQENVYLSYLAKEKIREMVPFSICSYYQIISQIKINFDGKLDVSVEDVLPLFQEAKVDHFELVSLFGLKKMNEFYSKLIEQESKSAELVGSFYFLQSHLIKMYDPSFLDEKSRLTKYDKQIMAHANIWSKPQIMRGINYLSEMIIKSKKKDLFFDHELKAGLLKTINF